MDETTRLEHYEQGCAETLERRQAAGIAAGERDHLWHDLMLGGLARILAAQGLQPQSAHASLAEELGYTFGSYPLGLLGPGRPLPEIVRALCHALVDKLPDPGQLGSVTMDTQLPYAARQVLDARPLGDFYGATSTTPTQWLIDKLAKSLSEPGQYSLRAVLDEARRYARGLRRRAELVEALIADGQCDAPTALGLRWSREIAGKVEQAADRRETYAREVLAEVTRHYQRLPRERAAELRPLLAEPLGWSSYAGNHVQPGAALVSDGHVAYLVAALPRHQGALEFLAREDPQFDKKHLLGPGMQTVVDGFVREAEAEGIEGLALGCRGELAYIVPRDPETVLRGHYQAIYVPVAALRLSLELSAWDRLVIHAKLDKIVLYRRGQVVGVMMTAANGHGEPLDLDFARRIARRHERRLRCRLLAELRPLAELKTGIYGGNRAAPGRYAGDGHVLFDTGAITAARAQRLTAPAKNVVIGAEPVSQDDAAAQFAAAVARAQVPAELLGYRQRLESKGIPRAMGDLAVRRVAYLAMAATGGSGVDRRIVAVNADRLRHIQAQARISKVRVGAGPEDPVVFFAGDGPDERPLAVLWPVIVPEALPRAAATARPEHALPAGAPKVTEREAKPRARRHASREQPACAAAA